MKFIPAFYGLLTLLFLAAMFVACKKEYSREGYFIPAAQGTLRDTGTWVCMPDAVNGTYYNGIAPGRDTAYILVNVQVTKAGSYSIYTNTVNGYSFSDSGYFSAIGLNTIKLKPVGIPAAQGTNTFNVTFDTSICSFTVNVHDSTGHGTGAAVTHVSTWQFTTPAGIVSGDSITAVAESLGNITEVGVSGKASWSDTLFRFSILLNTPGIPETAEVETNSIHGSFGSSATAGVVYSSSVSTPGQVVTLEITYSVGSKRLKGSFSGTAKGPGGGTVNITNGSFTVQVK